MGAGTSTDIAIVGMSVNVPGAQSVETYWENLRDGVESIRRLDDAALLAAGESLEKMRRKNYVPAAAVLDGFEEFDADFFGFSPKDAAILDPQHRKFLEVAWEAMEQAGHPPETIPGPVGVYAGCGMGSYFYFNICSNPDLVDDVGMFLLRHTGNDKDFLSTRVSHVFDLKGPSINLQTACSTSLVAIHYACQALHAGEVDMALAGGVTIELPQGRGYEFKENEILSPDGHCHAFDHRAQGTVFGSGAGAVALRRLDDAIADGDHIWAVIKGSAVNNDGAAKAGYLAPSVDGQSAAIVKALDAAGVAAQSIGYVECHGTGTYLGDPIEVAALTEAYRQSTQAEDFCRIGSVKTNIGHLDTAAGVAGLVKAALALHHEAMPPSLGFEKPNPAIGFEGSPFSVNASLTPWPRGDASRRAAINALGVGGTNAHTILQEAPVRAASEESDFPFHPMVVSARSKAALEANTAALAAHLRAHPEQPMADLAHTLKNGRRGFEKRRIVVAETHEEAAAALETGDTRRVFTHDHLGEGAQVVFMFPGGGAQYPDMARDLYETEPAFAEAMDQGLAHLQAQLDYDIRALWLPEPEARAAATEKLKKPSVQLPLIAIVEYALAQLWISWGVKPSAMVGHSMGENVAACLAGVMSFENLIDLVLLRGQLFDSVAPGGMLSVSLSRADLEGYLSEDLDIASVNGPQLTAVSGPDAALAALQERLSADDVDWQRIAIDIAAHSRMLEPILAEYRAFLATLDLQAPQMPFVSNRSGQMITSAQATDPDYWVGQLRNTVNFADCIDTLAAGPKRVFLEVGPGKALSSLAPMCAAVVPGQVLASLRHSDQDVADDAYFIGVIGRLWACGVEADWDQLWGEARRNRVLLPTYQFQRSPYFIAPGKAVVEAEPVIARSDDMAEWGAVPRWTPQFADVDADLDAALLAAKETRWLIFADAGGVANAVIARLQDAGHRVATVRAGDSFADLGEGNFTLAPEQGRDGYDALIAALSLTDMGPDQIGHFWLAGQDEDHRPGSSVFDRNMEHGFYSLMWLGQALGSRDGADPVHLNVFTTGAVQVRDEALAFPEKAMISGPAGVLPREVSGLTCSTVDFVMPEPQVASGFWARKPEDVDTQDMTDRLIEDLLATPVNAVVAHRDARRYVQSFAAQNLEAADVPGFQQGGTYLITGGFGGIGQTIAAQLLKSYGARVVLLSRTPFPPKAEWAEYLSSRAAGNATAQRIRAVRRLEALGGQVDVRVADVVNLAQMRRVIEALMAEGNIAGVIHAAGVLDDAPVLAKTQAAVDAVLAPKVQGLRVLDALLPDGTVDLMVLFASTSTATRAAGQVDYVAANDYLNAFARSRKGAQTRVVAVNWGVWADVGMAAEAFGAETAGPQPVNLPMLASSMVKAGGDAVFEASLDAKADWFLDQHRMEDGTAVMPGTGMIEALAEAAQLQGSATGFSLQDLYFLRPLSMSEGTLRQMRVQLHRDGEGYAAELRSDVVFEGRAGWQLNAQAQVVPLTGTAPAVDLDAIAARCGPIEEAGATRLRTPQEAHLAFGAQWQVLRSRALGKGEGLARLVLEEALTDGQILHPGLMDIATGWAVELAASYDAADLWVPVSYGEIAIHAPLPREVISWVRAAAETARDTARFDVTLCAPDGTVLVEVRDFSMTRLVGGFAAQTAALDPREVEFDEGTGAERVLSAAEERLAYAVSQGIMAAEGPEALERALSSGRSQIYVSALPLAALVKQADAPPVEISAGQSFERPDLDGTFVAPSTPTQEKLAVIWSNLLGVSPVGVEDSFFDLGGHSLIAVRLFATIKREFGVEFPISVLFEAPTIAGCADLIVAQIGEGEAGDDAPAKVPAGPSFSYLVPLNGVKNTAAPLFVVAGMFGNVLNLRHLALQFGSERAVYGLQARGLIGEDTPHETVQEAATAYLEELRQVQPEGPYLLSGFSGGGVTAYEMAQRLRAVGQEVAVLALLDTPLPVRPSLRRPDKALIKLHELRQKGPKYLSEWAQNRIAWEREKRQAGTTAPQVGFNNTKIEAAFLRAVGCYDTPAWDGPMTLLRPVLDCHYKVTGGNWVSAEREYVFADNDWTRYAPLVQVIEVPGDHDSMVLNPNVVVMASELREVIAEALGLAQDWQHATAAE
ncbi:polyketide synthase [Sulfitobacter sp. SK012]|uniref:type I polyketide synthase n=1 Tax=Sulfitobacter sp. SK012 TaxID=1389005 RepID=UPI000E0B078E|nr:type I polyketide synthase [Sulfitobacter sp. SK012]AXI48809.1 polyketide synthase [Sulfitobacter sp. SK012]